MPLVTGMVKEKLSFNAWTCGSSCALSGWICLQTFYHNERIRMVSLQCETSCVPAGARDERKLCYKCCTCGKGCGSEYAFVKLGWRHTFCDKCGKTWLFPTSTACGFACVLINWNLWQSFYHNLHTCIWFWRQRFGILIFHQFGTKSQL